MFSYNLHMSFCSFFLLFWSLRLCLFSLVKIKLGFSIVFVMAAVYRISENLQCK